MIEIRYMLCRTDGGPNFIGFSNWEIVEKDLPKANAQAKADGCNSRKLLDDPWFYYVMKETIAV